MTDNDTEVAAGYLTWRLRQGMSLAHALEATLADLDGFYTFAVGTKLATCRRAQARSSKSRISA